MFRFFLSLFGGLFGAKRTTPFPRHLQSDTVAASMLQRNRVDADPPGRVRDRNGGWARRLKACSEVAGGKPAAGGRRHRMAPPPSRPTLKGSSILWGVCEGRLCDPYRVGWNWCWGYRGRRPASAGLAHGYCRSAFQAVSPYRAEAAGSVTDPAAREEPSAVRETHGQTSLPVPPDRGMSARAKAHGSLESPSALI